MPADDGGRMNRSLLDVSGGILVVSQFTLLADVRRGRRPSYSRAAAPTAAEALYRSFMEKLASLGAPPQSGAFGRSMSVSYTNVGPVTIIIDSRTDL